MAGLNTQSGWRYIRGTQDLINAVHRNRNKLKRHINTVHLKKKNPKFS